MRRVHMLRRFAKRLVVLLNLTPLTLSSKTCAMQNRRNTASELLNDPDEETIAQLAAKLNNTVYDKSAELAREVLKRPRTGTDEWRSEVKPARRGTPADHAGVPDTVENPQSSQRGP